MKLFNSRITSTKEAILEINIPLPKSLVMPLIFRSTHNIDRLNCYEENFKELAELTLNKYQAIVIENVLTSTTDFRIYLRFSYKLPLHIYEKLNR